MRYRKTSSDTTICRSRSLLRFANYSGRVLFQLNSVTHSRNSHIHVCFWQAYCSHGWSTSRCLFWTKNILLTLCWRRERSTTASPNKIRYVSWGRERQITVWIGLILRARVRLGSLLANCWINRAQLACAWPSTEIWHPTGDHRVFPFP